MVDIDMKNISKFVESIKIDPQSLYLSTFHTKTGLIICLEQTLTKCSPGQESRGPCFHNNDSAAVRLCNVDGQWKRPDLSACNSKQSGEIIKVCYSLEK